MWTQSLPIRIRWQSVLVPPQRNRPCRLLGSECSGKTTTVLIIPALKRSKWDFSSLPEIRSPSQASSEIQTQKATYPWDRREGPSLPKTRRGMRVLGTRMWKGSCKMKWAIEAIKSILSRWVRTRTRIPQGGDFIIGCFKRISTTHSIMREGTKGS